MKASKRERENRKTNRSLFERVNRQTSRTGTRSLIETKHQVDLGPFSDARAFSFMKSTTHQIAFFVFVVRSDSFRASLLNGSL